MGSRILFDTDLHVLLSVLTSSYEQNLAWLTKEETLEISESELSAW
jgi:hypothetical protein